MRGLICRRRQCVLLLLVVVVLLGLNQLRFIRPSALRRPKTSLTTSLATSLAISPAAEVVVKTADRSKTEERSIGHESVLYYDPKHHHVRNGRVFLNDDSAARGLGPAQQAERGFSLMKKLRVAVAGTARNCRRILQLMRPRFESLVRKFDDFHFFFVENDSHDKTRDFLLDWGREAEWAGKIEVLGCGGVNLSTCHAEFAAGAHQPGGKKENADFERRRHRVDVMAQLRNLYLDRIFSAPARGQKPFDLVMVIDFDLMGTFSESGVARSVLHFENGDKTPFVDAVCANARGASLSYFWDACTIVFPPMNKFDPFPQPWEFVIYKSVISAVIPREPGRWRPQKVISCFQGFTIYRTESLKKYKARYTGPPKGYHTCEHNMLAYQLKNLYIEPSFDFHVTINASE